MADHKDYIDDPTTLPPSIANLKTVINTLPVSSSDCKRGFSSMNVIASDIRNKLSVTQISELLLLSLVGPPVSAFSPEKYVKVWLRG